jgi:hypothetical protein
VLDPSESAELTELDARFGARERWSGRWDGSLALWRRVADRVAAEFGSGGHGIDDLVFDVRVRDLLQEFIEAATPGLADKLQTAVAHADDVYRSSTTEGPQLLDALGETRPESWWWWRRVPRSGPLHESLA